MDVIQYHMNDEQQLQNSVKNTYCSTNLCSGPEFVLVLFSFASEGNCYIIFARKKNPNCINLLLKV